MPKIFRKFHNVTLAVAYPLDLCTFGKFVETVSTIDCCVVVMIHNATRFTALRKYTLYAFCVPLLSRLISYVVLINILTSAHKVALLKQEANVLKISAVKAVKGKQMLLQILNKLCFIPVGCF